MVISRRVRRLNVLAFLLVALLATSGVALAAQFVANGDGNGNHSPETQNTPNRGVGGETWSTRLNPAPAVSLGAGATAIDLARLQANFPPPANGNAGWVIQNGAALPGSLTVAQYDAFENQGPPNSQESPADNAFPGNNRQPCSFAANGGRDCYTVVYDNVVNNAHVNPVAPNTLNWIQLICTNSPRAGQPRCRPGAQPPAADAENNTSVDNAPNAPQLPFYLTPAQAPTFIGANNTPPFTFIDRPQRGFPMNRAQVNWRAHLYLVEWNGVTPNPTAPGMNGVITIHDGVEWGFQQSCIAINQPVGTFLAGGVDRDNPDTEIQGQQPLGGPSLECTDPHSPPTCTLTSFTPGPPAQIGITIQAVGSGLKTVTVTLANNAAVAVPAFDVGSADPLLVTATKLDQNLGAQVGLSLVDLAGNVTTCDPVLTTAVRGAGQPVRQSVAGVLQSESKAMVSNSGDGMDNLTLTVNAKDFRVGGLKAGQSTVVDLSSALAPGANDVHLTIRGKPGSSATVLFSSY